MLARNKANIRTAIDNVALFNMPVTTAQINNAAWDAADYGDIKTAFGQLRHKHDPVAIAFALMLLFPIDNYANLALFQALDIAHLLHTTEALEQRVAALEKENQTLKEDKQARITEDEKLSEAFGIFMGRIMHRAGAPGDQSMG